MPDPAARRDTDGIAFLLYCLKRPAAPTLLLHDAPEERRLAACAAALRRRRSADAVSAVIAALEDALAARGLRGLVQRHAELRIALAGYV
jgi:hypothetical protein